MAETPIDLLEGSIKPLTYDQFLDEIIRTGIDGARESYGDGTEKFRGSKDGFEACQGKVPIDLAKLLKSAREDNQAAYRENRPDYWYWRCRECEIEWVCNVVSAVLLNSGNEVIVQPTVRGVMHAQRILTGRV